MRIGDLVNGRYRLEEKLGSGAFCDTFKARLEGMDDFVALKVLRAGEGGLKGLDLFEREARALKALAHPRIPRYIDFFPYPDEGSFVLVQEFVEGKTLEALVADGARFTGQELARLFAQIVEVLGYLHGLHPPIIHRDVAPKNLILRDDGSLFLVDFSGVQEAIRLETRASMTSVGSSGYAPLEQFEGNATPRSDFYAAAAVMLFLMSHANPAKLPRKGLRVDWRAVIEAPPSFGPILDSWLDPDESGRTLGVGEALALLEGRADPGLAPGSRTAPGRGPGSGPRVDAMPAIALPSYSKASIVDGEDGFKLSVPPSGGFRNIMPMAMLGFMAIFMLSFFPAMWESFGSIDMPGFGGFGGFPGGFLFSPLLFMAPFVAAIGLLGRQALLPFTSRLDLEIKADGSWSASKRGVFLTRREEGASISDLGPCRIESSVGRSGRYGHGMRYGAYGQGGRVECLAIEAGLKTLRFGHGLTVAELEAIRDAVNRRLGRA
jgi:serine/threonine protein kinase